jgi:putative ABC transport system permease protein
MAKIRRHRWLLIRVAAQNAGRHRLRTILLGLAVMLGVGVGFAGFVAGWTLREGMETSFSRMGADLAVVPSTTLVNITASLLTVQPTDETLAADLTTSLRAIPGVARVAPQRIVPVVADGQAANVIGFEPASDFSVLPWLEDHGPGPVTANGVIVGGRLAGQSGQWLSLCGKPLTIYGRLGKTGVGPFDESYFVSFEGLAEIAAFCRAAPAATAEHAEARACPPDLPPSRVSAFLLQLSRRATVSDVKFTIAQLPGVKIVEGNNVMTASRRALGTLLVGIAVFTLFQLAALLILVSLLFSAIVQERHREVGLLRAMGARPDQVMTIILTEAGIITGLAGLSGLVFGAALLLIFARSLGFYLDLVGLPVIWPPLAVLGTSALAAVAFSASLGLAGAWLPARRVCRKAPYSLIHSEAA